MALKDPFINELKFESISTRKMLERAPMEKADWKPHEKAEAAMECQRTAQQGLKTPRNTTNPSTQIPSGSKEIVVADRK